MRPAKAPQRGPDTSEEIGGHVMSRERRVTPPPFSPKRLPCCDNSAAIRRTATNWRAHCQSSCTLTWVARGEPPNLSLGGHFSQAILAMARLSLLWFGYSPSSLAPLGARHFLINARSSGQRPVAGNARRSAHGSIRHRCAGNPQPEFPEGRQPRVCAVVLDQPSNVHRPRRRFFPAALSCCMMP